MKHNYATIQRVKNGFIVSVGTPDYTYLPPINNTRVATTVEELAALVASIFNETQEPTVISPYLTSSESGNPLPSNQQPPSPVC